MAADIDIKSGHFYLGEKVDPATGERSGEALQYDARDLTTHGVIVGMTGSGKTGLGVILLEEALLAGVPALVLDPKGDMGNLLLNFPELRPEDFRPWVNAGDARRKDMTVDEFAASTAETWRKGLAGSGLGSERMRRLASAAEVTVYTPGSSAGVPLNIIGSLAAPTLDFDEHAEALRDEIVGFVSSLLGLAGIEADPIASREHILLANLIETAWRARQDLDLAALIGQVQRPPLRKLGVFDLDTFFPEKDRLALAMRLNGLVASPSFAAWLEGPPIDIEALLTTADGRPRAAVVYLAHLSEAERQFIVTLVLSKTVTWMRGLSGTTDLRTLVYMDEVFGFAPPSAEPPSKKPILTLLKQGRAYGVGTVLATQNPVDLDYKAMSNAGTWCVGRLQTERDKARILDGLAAAHGGADVAAIDRIVGGLDKRQFLLHSTHEPKPSVFFTRWAMSYLRGPLTKHQIEQLTADDPERERAPAVAAPTEAAGAPAAVAPAAADDDETLVAPAVARGIPVHHLDPAAPWSEIVGAVPGGRRLEAALVARVHMRFDDRPAGIDHDEEWEAVFFPLGARLEAEAGVAVDYDPRDLRADAPEGATYVLPDAPVDGASFFRDAERDIKGYLYRERSVEVLRNRGIKLYSRVGETRAEFEARCARAAEEASDAAAAKLRDRFELRIDRAREQITTAEQRLEELEVDYESRGQEELLAGAGAVISALMGGRSSASKVARAARAMSGVSSRRSRKTRTGQRLTTAEEKVEAKAAALEDLQAKVLAEVQEIDDEWTAKATEIESVEIGLEKNDITVDEVALVWIPTGP